MESTYTRILAATSLLIVFAAPCAAQDRAADRMQRPAPRFATGTKRTVELPSHPVRVQETTGAFFIEWLGGTAGSLVGLGTFLLLASPDDCGSEDLGCILQRLGAAGIGSAIGAPIGTVMAGRAVDARPSVPGAILGSIAGAAAGVGLLALVEEVNGDALPLPFTLVTYTGVHGLFTAIGSRIGAALRD